MFEKHSVAIVHVVPSPPSALGPPTHWFATQTSVGRVQSALVWHGPPTNTSTIAVFEMPYRSYAVACSWCMPTPSEAGAMKFHGFIAAVPSG